MNNVHELIGRQPLFPVTDTELQAIIRQNVEALFYKENKMSWALMKIFTYGVIWGKRIERAKRNNTNISLYSFAAHKNYKHDTVSQ